MRNSQSRRLWKPKLRATMHCPVVNFTNVVEQREDSQRGWFLRCCPCYDWLRAERAPVRGQGWAVWDALLEGFVSRTGARQGWVHGEGRHILVRIIILIFRLFFSFYSLVFSKTCKWISTLGQAFHASIDAIRRTLLFVSFSYQLMHITKEYFTFSEI